jgi:glutaredoxin
MTSESFEEIQQNVKSIGLPQFYVNQQNIHIIHEPKLFYETLLVFLENF